MPVWNALIKVSGDRVAVMALVTVSGSVISLAFLPFVAAPGPESWPLLALSILSHTGYHFFLSIAYDHGDLGQVYPMARGAAPIIVTLGAFLLAGETVGLLPLLGICCLAVGVMTLAFDKGIGIAKNRKAVLFAIGTGCCIAAYTLVDGLGVRQAGSVLGFAVWLTIGDGLLTFLIALVWKRSVIWQVGAREHLDGCIGRRHADRRLLDYRLGSGLCADGNGLGLA